MQNILAENTLLQRPLFCYPPLNKQQSGRIHFNYILYPYTLAQTKRLAPLIPALHINPQTLIKCEDVEIVRLASTTDPNQRPTVTTLLTTAYARPRTLQNENRFYRFYHRLDHLPNAQRAALLAPALLALTPTATRLIEDLGIKKEAEQMRDDIHRHGLDTDTTTHHYLGLTDWGNIIDYLAQRYHWTYHYILYHLSADNITLLMADAPRDLYLPDHTHPNNPNSRIQQRQHKAGSPASECPL